MEIKSLLLNIGIIVLTLSMVCLVGYSTMQSVTEYIEWCDSTYGIDAWEWQNAESTGFGEQHECVRRDNIQ